jgi:hypothetical protein
LSKLEILPNLIYLEYVIGFSEIRKPLKTSCIAVIYLEYSCFKISIFTGKNPTTLSQNKYPFKKGIMGFRSSNKTKNLQRYIPNYRTS